MSDSSISTATSGTPAPPTAEEWVRSSGTTLLVTGILTLLLGIFSMAAPLVSGIAIALLVGAFLVVSGVFRCVLGFRSKAWGQGILGILVAIAGGIMLARPGMGLATLALVVAWFFFAYGVIEAVYAFHLKPVRGWGWVLFNGIISIVLGILILAKWPLSGAWAIGVLVGVNLLFTGITMIWLGLAGRSLAKDIAGTA